VKAIRKVGKKIVECLSFLSNIEMVLVGGLFAVLIIYAVFHYVTSWIQAL